MANLNPFIEVVHKDQQKDSMGTVVGHGLTLDVVASTEDMARRRAKAYALRNYRTKPSEMHMDAVDMVSDGYTIMEKLTGPTPVATYRVEMNV